MSCILQLIPPGAEVILLLLRPIKKKTLLTARFPPAYDRKTHKDVTLD